MQGKATLQAFPPLVPLSSTHSPLQVLYNDLSPMENHHSAAAFTILLDKDCNFLSGKSRPVSKRVGVRSERWGGWVHWEGGEK